MPTHRASAGLAGLAARLLRPSRAGRMLCEDIDDDFDCIRPASCIGEYAPFGETLRRVALCRRHGWRKPQPRWTVWRATRQQLRDLAAQRINPDDDDSGGRP